MGVTHPHQILGQARGEKERERGTGELIRDWEVLLLAFRPWLLRC
jgi:hypothetical protein